MTTIDAGQVYAAQRDTRLLARALAVALPDGAHSGWWPPVRVLDLGTGGGALAVQAAACPGTEVTAVDVSSEALLATGLAALGQQVAVRLLLGDLIAPVVDETFDLVVCDPPYVPAPETAVPERGPARAWDAGRDGRAVLDRLCEQVPRVIALGGALLIVQSAVSGVDRTRTRLEDQGLVTEVVARCMHPFGPVMTSRIEYLEQVDLIEVGCRTEELVVIRGRR